LKSLKSHAPPGARDERYWMYLEDLDLCYRLRQAGWVAWEEPSVSAPHVKGGSVTRPSPQLVLAFHAGMWRFYRAHVASRHSAPVNASVGAAPALKLAGAVTRSLVSGTRHAVSGGSARR
jgi:GT2 family glycosyltransferase